MKINFKTNASFVNANGETVNFETYFNVVWQFAEREYRRGRISEDDAKDLFQDAVLKILVSAPRHCGEKCFPKSYGYRTAKSCYINQWHSAQGCDPFSRFVLEGEEGDEFTKKEITSWHCNDYNPEMEVASSEITDFIWECVDSLEKTDRIIVTSVIFGEKPKDIAKRLAMTPDSVSVRLHRARKALRRKLGHLLRDYKMCA